MAEYFIIPNGEHQAYYRQFGKLNRIEPIQLQIGDWILPITIINMLQTTYVDLKSDPERLAQRLDATLSICDFAEATIADLSLFPQREVDPSEIHERYKT